MAAWTLPRRIAEFCDVLTTGLDRRSRKYVFAMILGMLLASGRRTVSSWLRAAGVAECGGIARGSPFSETRVRGSAGTTLEPLQWLAESSEFGRSHVYTQPRSWTLWMRPDDMLETFSELAVREPDLMRLVLQASVAALVNSQSVMALEAELKRRAGPRN